MQLDEAGFDELPIILPQRWGFPLSGIRRRGHCWHNIVTGVAGVAGYWKLLLRCEGTIQIWIERQQHLAASEAIAVGGCGVAIGLNRMAGKMTALVAGGEWHPLRIAL